MTKQQLRDYGQNGYRFAGSWDGLRHFTKEVYFRPERISDTETTIGQRKYGLVSLLDEDLINGSYKMFFDKELTRI